MIFQHPGPVFIQAISSCCISSLVRNTMHNLRRLKSPAPSCLRMAIGGQVPKMRFYFLSGREFRVLGLLLSRGLPSHSQGELLSFIQASQKCSFVLLLASLFWAILKYAEIPLKLVLPSCAKMGLKHDDQIEIKITRTVVFNNDIGTR